MRGNIEALEQALAISDEAGVDEIVCLGDLVGYGADPSECIARICDRAAFVCAGNHDWAASRLIDTSNLSGMASEAIRWTKEALEDADLEWLEALPLAKRRGSVEFVHGSNHDPEQFPYIFGSPEAAFALKRIDADLVFVGHSDRAFVFAEDSGEIVQAEGEAVVPEGRVLVNVGSVGQPRDGEP
ncbi:MAG: metallophosphoesterase [Gemmatimonadetes bacterium]|nr:metallophosphoesterase [Gemmatimonadota bacterium]